MMTDEAVWKKRFFQMMAVRFAGTALALLGLVIGFGDLVEPGGNQPLGLVFLAAGVLAIALLPRALSRRWREP